MTSVEEPIQLIGARTGNCLRVAIAFEEAGIPYSVQRLNLAAGEHRGPEHLKLNPAGKVPTIIANSDEGSLVLSQSNAILQYAADLRPGVLLPLGTNQRAIALERFYYFVTDVIAVSHAAFFLQMGGELHAAERLDAKANGAIRSAARFVEEHPFMAGSHFTLADIAAYSIVSASSKHIDWDAVPALKGWFERVASRPSVLRGASAFDRPSA